MSDMKSKSETKKPGPRLSVQFNLETGPVNGESTNHSDTLRETAAMSGGAHTADRIWTVWFVILLLGLFLIAAVIGGWFIIRAFTPDADQKDVRRNHASETRQVLSTTGEVR